MTDANFRVYDVVRLRISSVPTGTEPLPVGWVDREATVTEVRSDNTFLVNLKGVGDQVIIFSSEMVLIERPTFPDGHGPNNIHLAQELPP